MFLAADIGKGTQDILIPVPGEIEENWVKAVLPSPTKKLAEKVRNFEGDLRICGFTMGGGPLKKALLEHLEKGFKVIMTVDAARTVRDDIDYVRLLGVEVVEELDSCDLFLSDLEFDIYHKILQFSNLQKPKKIGIACQDHGYQPGQSDRITRFEFLKRLLQKEREPEKMIIKEETRFFSRFDSVLEQIERAGLEGFVMDSKIAAIAGVKSIAGKEGVGEFVCIDCGNGHTMVSTVKDGKICGFFEHHTRFLDEKKLKNFMVKLIMGTLTFKEVFEDGGHGALVIEAVKPEKVYLVGPNRWKFRNLGEFAYPLGDSMMFGCAGLVEAAQTAGYFTLTNETV